MTVIQLTQQLNSDTLHVPELKSLIGKQVEITIRELPEANAAANRWQALQALAGKDLVDAEVYRAYREFDLRQQRKAP